MEESAGNNEEVGDLAQGGGDPAVGEDNTPDFLDFGNPIPNHVGVTSLGMISTGEVDQALLSKLNLDDYVAPGEPHPFTSPPRSPSGGVKHCLLSPITPLDLLGSPMQPWKKLRGAVEKLVDSKIVEGHDNGMMTCGIEA